MLLAWCCVFLLSCCCQYTPLGHFMLSHRYTHKLKSITQLLKYTQDSSQWEACWPLAILCWKKCVCRMPRSSCSWTSFVFQIPGFFQEKKQNRGPSLPVQKIQPNKKLNTKGISWIRIVPKTEHEKAVSCILLGNDRLTWKEKKNKAEIKSDSGVVGQIAL